jgi:hypothetical protein
MDAPPKPPIVLAERLIKQFVDHLVAGAPEIKPDDFMAIRVVFRKCGGNWEKIIHGDIVQVSLLAKIATVWANSASKSSEGKNA